MHHGTERRILKLEAHAKGLAAADITSSSPGGGQNVTEFQHIAAG